MKVLTEKEFIAEVIKLNKQIIYMIEHEVKINKNIPTRKILAQSHLVNVLHILTKSE